MSPPLKQKLLYSAVGIAAAGAFTLSCSDHPKVVDAATSCDCPASEPPLKTRLSRPTMSQSISANSIGDVLAECPNSGKIIGGACMQDDGGADPNIVLIQGGFGVQDVTSYRCTYKNNTAQPFFVRAVAVCLVDAP